MKKTIYGQVELATLSFGQRFNITPLQMITTVSGIVNDGLMMKPRIVKQSINTDTNVVTNYDSEEVRQVVSKETSEVVRNMLRSVVTDGTGGYANISGYTVGGKSGTSEPPVTKEELGYTASFIGITPIADTKVVILVTLYQPSNGKYQGGETAGPVVNQILSEILPYMGIPSNNSEYDGPSSNSDTTLPDVRNKTITEAEKILKNAGFKVKISTNKDRNSSLVSNQVPKPGAKLSSESIIYLYEEEDVSVSVKVPRLTGMTLEQATNALRSKNLNINYEGSRKGH